MTWVSKGSQWVAVSFLATIQLCRAVSVSPDELAQSRRWVAVRFEGAQQTRPLQPGLVVQANHDPVIKNGRGGKLLRLAGQEFTRGLDCHAFSKIIVRTLTPLHDCASSNRTHDLA